MSDTSQGEGWWQASDGKWYPPESHPEQTEEEAGGAGGAGAAAPAAAAGDERPTRFEFDGPDEIARWRPLVHWLLAIPHYLVLWVLGFVFGNLQFVSFFTVLFTKRIPEGIFNFQVMVQRYSGRVFTYMNFMREDYPPFAFDTVAEDDLKDPTTRTSIDYPIELNRWLPLVKWLLAIPHYIVLFFVYIGAYVALIIAFFAVIFTKKYPEGILNFLVGTHRWTLRVYAYVGLLRDEYPPFSLS